MCGITGLLSLVGAPPEPGLVQGMLGVIVHRGPDDEGCEALGPAVIGMRRLSILDPTPDGHQPMRSPDGRHVIVFNGEVYNFLELADELRALGCTFRTQSDTEVILAAYATWGTACVERFNGIFAIAIWDVADQSLFLARDHFGVKPLFLAEGNGLLAFASEIKALRTLPWVTAEPEPSAVFDYLVDGSVDRGERTFFRDVRRFPAAHSLLVTRHGRRWSRYWTPGELSTDASFRPGPRDDELIESFRSTLVDAVALQLRSDVAIGSCLSGGLDSSSIVSIAANLRGGGSLGRMLSHREREATPQLAFFAQFREAGIDERPYVDAVVEATGVTLRTTTPDSADFLETLDSVLAAQDEPFGSLSIVAQYHVMKLAREAGVKVLLDGQGADELLGGYRHYTGLRVAGALRSGEVATTFEGAWRVVVGTAPRRSSLGHAVLGGRRLPPALIRGRMPASWFGPRARRDGTPEPGEPTLAGTVLARALWRDVAIDNLPALLRYEDRNSMAFGIEARVPFLDHRLVEAALALPDRLKVDGTGRRKIALRRAMEGIVPAPVLARRDKVAFQPPQARWLADSLGAWRDLAIVPRAEASGLLAPGAVGDAISAFAAKRISGDVLWRVLNLELWLRRSHESTG